MSKHATTGSILIGIFSSLTLGTQLSGCVACSPGGPRTQWFCLGGREYSYDSTQHSRDILGSIAEDEESRLAEDAARIAERFALSEEQGLRIARITSDYQNLQNRSDRDLADFSQRLYGVDPREIADAVAQAQLGNRQEMNNLVDRAALHFGTDPETMKGIARELHGRALQDMGVDL